MSNKKAKMMQMRASTNSLNYSSDVKGARRREVTGKEGTSRHTKIKVKFDRPMASYQ